MIQTFTLDDVARYAYQEMATEEAERFQEALVFDDELRDMSHQFSAVLRAVDAPQMLKEPPRRAIDRILEYSQTYDVAASH
ncbi:MAG: hypothetical protein WA960_13530 [Tunicatimonas sp.]